MKWHKTQENHQECFFVLQINFPISNFNSQTLLVQKLMKNKFPYIFSSLVVCGVRGRNQKIVGGSETLPNEYPWVAGLFKQNKLYCGATIVTPNYLLTVE